jgi:hypothetical protein
MTNGLVHASRYWVAISGLGCWARVNLNFDRRSAVIALAMLAPLTAVADNHIATENAQPGSAEGGLTLPATQRQIEGYASATSVNRGETIDLFVGTYASSFELEVF